MDIALLQKQICKVITGIGGRIKYAKELGFPARIYYFLSRKEPVINIEALFLGERFAVIIGQETGRRHRDTFNASGYRIMHCSSLEDFNKQFDLFKSEKLSER